MNYFTDAIGSASAGVLGYITSGPKGAKKSIGAFNSYQKRMKRKAEPITMKQLRTAVKRRKVVVLKRSKGQKKTMKAKTRAKLSSKAVSQVKRIALKVLHEERPGGSYYKHIIGNFPQVLGAPTLPLQNVCNQLYYGASSGYTDFNLCAGSLNKIRDSASVLFNGKAAGFYTGTGNISVTQCIIPDFKQINTYEFYNNTPLLQRFLIYECVTKEDTDNNVYDNWNACSLNQVGGAVNSVGYFGMRPEMYPQFRDMYKFTKKLVSLKPGGRFTYKLSVSSRHVRFDDWMKQGTNNAWNYKKGFSKELLIINWNAVVAGKNAVGSDAWMAGAWNVANNDDYGIAVQVNETYKMKCPENVDNVNEKDNLVCVWSQYKSQIASTAVPIITPAISQPIAVQ